MVRGWIGAPRDARAAKMRGEGSPSLEIEAAMDFESALQLSRTACGLGAPLSLVCQEASSSAGAFAPLDYPRPFLLVGRHPLADLSLNNPQVSRRHTYLQAIAGRVFCVDLESRTQTRWEGEEAARSQGWLDPGRFIQVGPYRIHRTDRGPDEPAGSEALDPFAPPDGEGSEPDSLPRLMLELPMWVGGQPAIWAMRGLLALMGRSERCQFSFGDDSISRYHACLVRTPLGLWVVDLAAREGCTSTGSGCAGPGSPRVTCSDSVGSPSSFVMKPHPRGSVVVTCLSRPGPVRPHPRLLVPSPLRNRPGAGGEAWRSGSRRAVPA
jgi:pSer/pThr/pTyr-binding forkhead associated (FHA) protein